MAHYFTREEAEALLPAITLILRRIQDEHEKMSIIEGRTRSSPGTIHGEWSSPP